MKESTHVPVAYVRRAHGIHGDVVVRGLVSDAADRLVAGSAVRTAPPTEHEYGISSNRAHQGDLVLHLEGVDDRDAAEALVGTQFVMDPDDRRSLGPGEWWPEDLIGCTVIDLEGATVGSVVDVIVGAAQDRLAVETVDGRRGEVPFVDVLVPGVDTETRQIVVDLPDGLFEVVGQVE